MDKLSEPIEVSHRNVGCGMADSFDELLSFVVCRAITLGNKRIDRTLAVTRRSFYADFCNFMVGGINFIVASGILRLLHVLLLGKSIAQIAGRSQEGHDKQ